MEATLQHAGRIAPDQVSARTRYAESPKYAEGLYDLGSNLYAWMVPNGSWGESNAGLIVGNGASLLVDTLWDVRYTRAMLAAMQPILASAPLKTLINTHADGDHWWGNQLIDGAEIITSQASLAEMGHVKPQSMVTLGKLGKAFSAVRVFGASESGHWFQNMVAPYHFEEVIPKFPTRTFTGELTLDVGGREVRVIEVGPMHTLGDAMVYVPDARTLYSADVLFIGSTPVMWAGPVENWIAALDRILSMDVDVIVPGHGPITDKQGVQSVKDYWVYMSREVRARFDAGKSAKQAAYEIALSKDFAAQPFAQWNSPERIMTSAHTMYRHWKGSPKPASIPQTISILAKQGRLAHRLPDAQPAVMRM